jgi:hypothetical protein
MGYVTCPHYQIHCTKDEIIPFSHAELVRKAAPKHFEPWYPVTGGHDEIKEKNHDEYYDKLKQFLQFVDDLTKNMSDQEFVTKFRGNLPQDFPHFYKDEFKPKIDTKYPSKPFPTDLNFDFFF